MICALLILGLSAPANAISLSQLFAGADITLGDVTFSNWKNLGSEVTGTAKTPNPNNIQVLPVGIDPLHPLLVFEPNEELRVNGIGTLEYLIQYQATSAANRPMDANLLWGSFETNLAPGITFGHSTSIREFVANNQLGDGFGSSIIDGPKTVFQKAGSPLDVKNLDGKNFQPIFGHPSNLYNNILVDTNINIENEEFATSFVGVDLYAQEFSQVPIPGAVWLLGSGMLGLLGLRRRFKE
jgi:hypothetical protein